MGRSPLIQHNAQLSNPANEFAKKIKKISAKRNKTEADHDRMAELEFKGGLYVDENNRVILPASGLEAVIRDGAKKSKEGKVVQSGVFVEEDAFLVYDGPQDGNDLWEDKKFVSQMSVRVGQARIIRTRPIFKKWSCDVEVVFNDSVVTEDQLVGWLQTAGEQCGAFDYRPKHGRFTVEVIEAAKAEAA